MKITLNVQTMTDSGENVLVQLQEATTTAGTAPGMYGQNSMSLTLTKAEAADYFPGKKFTATLAAVPVTA